MLAGATVTDEARAAAARDFFNPRMREARS